MHKFFLGIFIIFCRDQNIKIKEFNWGQLWKFNGRKMSSWIEFRFPLNIRIMVIIPKSVGPSLLRLWFQALILQVNESLISIPEFFIPVNKYTIKLTIILPIHFYEPHPWILIFIVNGGGGMQPSRSRQWIVNSPSAGSIPIVRP